jgi:hypothetical protein
MAFDLAAALSQLPRKGESSYPFLALSHTRSQRAKALWMVHENLHQWALEQGYLTGCIFKQTQRSKTRYKLLLVGHCPHSPGKLRYYTATLLPA